MVRNSQKLSVIGLLAVLFIMGMSGAMADSALEVDYYGGYDAAGTTMQGNLSSAYEVAANEITRWIQVIFNRAPLAGEVEGWVTGYFAYMVSLFIDVEYVIQEMARQFFTSVEYAWIYNGNMETFIRDAYGAFLNRSPNPTELANWLAGAANWDIETALSAFWAAGEVSGRVNFLFGTDYAGLQAENLTSQFYLGILNRLPTEDELDAWTDVFGDDTLQAHFIADGILIAQTLIDSAEFDLANKTNAEVVMALYRGFFNRFAAVWEIESRVNMMTGLTGNLTIPQLISLLANDPGGEYLARVVALQ